MDDNSTLDPTPGNPPPPSVTDILAGSSSRKPSAIPDNVKKDVAKHKAKEPPAQKFTRDKEELVTIEEYHKMMEDRPVKFGPKTSGFVRGGGKKDIATTCLHCVHYYTSPASAHSTCEIVRESDEKDQVMADDTCKLFSKDGQTLPLLESEEETEA